MLRLGRNLYKVLTVGKYELLYKNILNMGITTKEEKQFLMINNFKIKYLK